MADDVSPGPWDWEPIDGTAVLWSGPDQRGGRLAILEAPHVAPKPADASAIAAVTELLALAKAVERFGQSAFAPYRQVERACRICDVVSHQDATPYKHAPDCLIEIADRALAKARGTLTMLDYGTKGGDRG